MKWKNFDWKKRREPVVPDWTRRQSIVSTCLKAVSVLTLIVPYGPMRSSAAESSDVSPDDALKRLVEGNARFVAANPVRLEGETLIQRRAELVDGQKPFAILVSCSDSRVPPELIFDQGLGDMFVVRTAGEVVDSIGLGSIEYGVEHLGASLIVVLGHARCGAVSAAVSGAAEPGQISAVLKAIQPAVAEVKGKSGDQVDNAVRAQARVVARRLGGEDPVLAPRVQSKKLKIVAAYYDLGTGRVEFLKP
jgi:carbonic anhydrase